MYPAISVPDTQHAVFYSYAIHANTTQLGSFEKFSYDSNRNVERIREIYESRGPSVKDMVWTGTDIAITATRVELYVESVFKAFGIDIFTLEDWNQFVDITEVMHRPNGSRRSLTFQKCIMDKWGTSRDVSNAKIVSEISFQCCTIYGVEL